MTIRKRLVLSYIAMLVVPFALFFMMSGFIYFLSGASLEGEGFEEAYRSPGSVFRSVSGQLSAAQILAMSRIIASNPNFFQDSASMGKAIQELSWTGSVVVTRDGKIAYASPGTRDKDLLNSLDGKNRISAIMPGRMMRSHIRLAYSWEFAVAGGSPATIHFFYDYGKRMKTLFAPALILFAACALALVFTNGFLTVIVSRSVMRPLAHLEAMALRIRDGDLSGQGGPSALARHRSDEFDAAFRAFEEMRLRLRESLERQLREEDGRRELIASISHDLRTPLSAVKGYAEGLRDGVAATEEKRKAYIDTLLAKAGELDRLIDDLFLFSRLELKDFPYDKRAIELNSYLRDCAAELAPDFPSLAISFVPAPEPLPVSLDPVRMKRVATNIAQNAAAYSGRSDARLEIKASREGPYAVVRFSDNGPGLGAGQLETVFERFRRLDPARGKTGAGLGLSIARLIVEAQGGEIRAENDPRGGACFALSLPLLEKT
jgi:signal transduction histidine kinase